MFSFWRECKEAIFQLQKYANLREYDEFANLLVEFLPQKESVTFVEASLQNAKQKAAPIHPLLSVHYYHPSFRGSLTREERNKLATSIFYRTINLQYEAKRRDVSSELLSIMQMLKTPLRACSILQTKELYTNLSHSFSLTLEQCKNTSFIILIIQEARSYFSYQLAQDKANENLLFRIVPL